MRGARRTVLLLGTAVAIGVFCFGAQSPAAPHASNCTGTKTREALVAFLAAYNRGDSETLDALFAQQPDFEWYSSDRPGTRLGTQARDRSTLLGYFKRRHRLEDRLRLVSFQFNGDYGRYGNFGLTLKRSVSNFRDGDSFQLAGKGALICAEDATQFIVMTLGGPEPRPGAGT